MKTIKEMRSVIFDACKNDISFANNEVCDEGDAWNIGVYTCIKDMSKEQLMKKYLIAKEICDKEDAKYQDEEATQ